jgi:hypothetical protein
MHEFMKEKIFFNSKLDLNFQKNYNMAFNSIKMQEFLLYLLVNLRFLYRSILSPPKFL